LVVIEVTKLMDMADLAQRFMLTEGACGYEKKMALLLRDILSSSAGETRIDRAGNVITRVEGRDPAAPVVMVCAHMDQLGFIIRNIEETGMVRLARLGGVPEKALPALAVSVANLDGDYLPGVIGVKSHHAASADEKNKVDGLDDLYVDIGATSRQEVLDAGVHVGCPVIYKPSYERLMGTRVSGTAVDNRCGLAALVEIARALRERQPASTTWLVGSVMEEFNVRGAVFAARAIKPDIAVCLDIALAGDTPDLHGRYNVKLGGGPVVSLYNFHGRGTLNGALAHAGLYRLAREQADRLNCDLQEFASVGLITESAYIQMEGNYIACIDMGFPARYTHTPVECCDLSDVITMSELVTSMIRSISQEFPLGRY
jgi:putative aminopeptidase FrvX